MSNVFICYERCSTCKKAEKWLDAHGVDYEKRPIKEQNPTAKELKKWIQKSGQLRFKTANGEAGCLVAAAMKGVDTKADPFQFFALQMDAFTILDNSSHNKIAIGGVPVFVTFDERFDKALLGRDIISLLNLNINNDRK